MGQSCLGDTATGVPAEACCAVELDQTGQAGAGSDNEARCLNVKYLNLTTSVSESCQYHPGGGAINNRIVGWGWKVKATLVALDWAVFHVVLEGLALFLMEKGAGEP